MITMPVPPLPRTDNVQSSDVRAARHHMIDAAVVRTMKARKRLHAEVSNVYPSVCTTSVLCFLLVK